MKFATIAIAAAAMAACETSAPPGPGTIAVTTFAQSDEPFVFAYGVVVDNGTPREVQISQSVSFFETGSAGDHVVSTTGLPSVCSGGESKTVSVVSGDTVPVNFAITCGRTTGDISVKVTTTGTDIDADGYRIMVDSVFATRSATTDVKTIKWQPVGPRIVYLDEVASNCVRPPAKTLAVATGATTEFAFTVTCTPVGFLKVVSSTTGADRDPDGTLMLVGASGFRIPPSGSTVLRLNVGTYNYGIFDVAPNCSLSVSQVGGVSITAGDTAQLSAPLNCVAVGDGVAGLVATDPVGDTLGVGTMPAIDAVSISARYLPGWLKLVVRFSAPVAPQSLAAANSLFGNIDLDLDENPLTGRQPLANTAGGSAVQGVDYSISFFKGDTSSAELQLVGVPPLAVVGRVRTIYSGDSVVVQIPLNKISNDDGNMTISAIFGTSQRITDILPNTGKITLRVP